METLTPAELAELHERVEDSEREVDLVMAEVQWRRQASDKDAAEIESLHDQLQQLEEEGQAEYMKEIERLTTELKKAAGVESELKNRIREMEEEAANKPRSRFCIVM